MLSRLRKRAQDLSDAVGPGALVLGLALMTSGCASNSSGHAPATNSSGMTSEELYNEYDANNNNQIDQDEWNAAYRSMDTNGDGVVTQSEFAAARGGGRR